MCIRDSMDIRKDGWWYQPLEDPRAKTKIEMPAHTSKEFVSVWDCLLYTSKKEIANK